MKLKVIILVVCIVCSLSMSWCQELPSGAAAARIPASEYVMTRETVDPDLVSDATLWRWSPWKIWKWDSQRTLTRRDSSLIVGNRRYHDDWDTEGFSTARLTVTSGASGGSLDGNAKGSVQNELVNVLFESMLDYVVESWEVISPSRAPESFPNISVPKAASESNVHKKKKSAIVKQQKSKRSRSKMDIDDASQQHSPASAQSLQRSWCAAPSERAVIRFRNGNVYEGSVSMKGMHGHGRFQWLDGTVYMGHFDHNEIKGIGMIQWRDQSWYEGAFLGNLRHGNGLYVDSRRQRTYFGDWHYGSKHGQGVMYFSNDFKNAYDGEWVYNVRHGYGSREYCALSGYKGEWNMYLREGLGFMIWPNHDIYEGQWKNGVMSGNGSYTWDSFYNNSFSCPSINAYRGQWEQGQRNGYGVLNLGLDLSGCYKGEFQNDKKHGVGRFVMNNGYILQNKKLFIQDNIAPVRSDGTEAPIGINQILNEPLQFNISDIKVSLSYHIELAINNLDKEEEFISGIVSEYVSNNNMIRPVRILSSKDSTKEDMLNVVQFEQISLRKALQCYEPDLKNIYYTYATIYNKEEIYFAPVLIRLQLWQMYYDCEVHAKRLTLVEIDRMLQRNPEWLIKSAHNPFEKISFWQFLHSVIGVAAKLYAKKQIPKHRPDTILASAFRQFMKKDLLPGVNQRRGKLANGYIDLLPLKSLYTLYRKIGEPHSIRDYLCATRYPSHWTDPMPPLMIGDPTSSMGRNVYIFSDEFGFITENMQTVDTREEYDLHLFNFSNLSSKAMIIFFANIFPQVVQNNMILNVNVEITFFEFFEVFIICAEESIKISLEEEKKERLLASELEHFLAAQRPPDKKKQ